jgi:hypothetical protein
MREKLFTAEPVEIYAEHAEKGLTTGDTEEHRGRAHRDDDGLPDTIRQLGREEMLTSRFRFENLRSVEMWF